ncbi:MAG TPA: tRNA (adenosine(37)-N6)-dimethylallyltransferase MiaA [Longimicrobiales bacterium]|nr:tRNA (adenosine(37)-N6)-dimethylallyltransferase MiaA [Longimicrobiales bacterium]
MSPAVDRSAGGPPRGIALTGATTSGKTSVALELARRLGGEIISMDSRQVYRGMDIGTDKVSDGHRVEIPHHGLDLVDPGERYSAGRFSRDARRWIGEIEARGRVPILAGGTGFFLKSLTHPIFDEPEMDADRRSRLQSWLDEQPPERLADWVRRLDPDRAELAIEGGPQRLTRTLEVPLLTGRSLSAWHRRRPAAHQPVPLLVVVLDVDRAELDRRIDARVDRMVRDGLVEEVESLLERGFGPDAPGMTGTGYREIVDVLREGRDLDDALDDMRAQTRRYARRQITWFRHQLPDDAIVIEADAPASDPDALEDRVERIIEEWRRRRGEETP